MRKYLVLPDGTTYELSPITYEEFVALGLWVGGSDTAYDQWLRQNNFHIIEDFRDEVVRTSRVLLLPRQPFYADEFFFDPKGDNEWRRISNTVIKD